MTDRRCRPSQIRTIGNEFASKLARFGRFIAQKGRASVTIALWTPRTQTCSRRSTPPSWASGCALPAWRRGGHRPSWPVTTSPSATSRGSSPGSADRTARRLDDLAVRLGVPTEHLLRGVTAREYDEIKLTLDFAELSLETGQHLEAESQAREAVDRAIVGVPGRARLPRPLPHRPRPGGPGQPRRRHPRARAAGLLPPGRRAPDQERDRAVPLPQDSGDLTAAIEVGERVLAQLVGSPLEAATRRAAGRDAGGCLLLPRRHRPGRPDLPQGDRQGRGARLPRRPRVGVLERQRLRVRARLGRPTPSRWPSAPSPCWPRARTPATWPGCAPSSAAMQLELDPPEVAEAHEHLTRRPKSWPGAAPARSRSRGNELARSRAHTSSRATSRRPETCVPTISPWPTARLR